MTLSKIQYIVKSYDWEGVLLGEDIILNLKYRIMFYKYYNFILRKLSTVCNDDLLWWLARLWTQSFNFLYDFHALNNIAENDMSTIQPRSLHSGNKELGAISVWSCIGHG